MENNIWKKGIVVAIIVLFVGASVVPSTGSIALDKYSQPNTVYVDDDFNESTPGWGYDHFDSIQDGVDAVNESGTVYIYNGTYNEYVEITKTLELHGESRENTIIDGTGIDYCLRILSPANNVTVTNLTTRNAQSIGVSIRVSDCVIDNVTSCWNTNDYGFYPRGASNIVIKNCLAHNNERGIFDRETDGLEVYGCTFRDNTDYGMNTYFATTNAYIHHNNFISNGVNVEDVSDGSNVWDYNYYDDYSGIDADGDGTGDNPYDIEGSAGEQDLHPLMYPWYPTHPDIVYVDDDFDNSTPGWGYDRFNRIQYGVNEVEGSTVYVYSGVYNEIIRINNSINLIGEDKNSTIIDGNQVSDVTVRIFVDSVNISGFTIQESGYGYSGVCTYANNTNISNNIVKSNGHHGITVRNSSSNNIISNNIIFGNNQNGINIQDVSKNNTISGNNISNNEYGIQLWDSSSNTITGNNITLNWGDGIYLDWHSNSNNITDNNISSNIWSGIILYDSSKNTITGNTISNNLEDGIIFIESSFDNTIMGNTIISNNENGIHLYDSDSNNITGNSITSNNHYGIYLQSYNKNNTIYHNNFINNTINAYDDGINIWDDGYPSGGNYWDDYVGDDLFSGQNQDIPGPDGIGDTPYNITSGDNRDHYPLIHPFELYYILNISAPPEVNEGELFNVVVKSEGGTAIPNALVEFNYVIKLTDFNGIAQFIAPSLVEDTLFWINVTKEGYTGDSETILVKDVPVEFVSTFIFGRIDNLTITGEYITFEAVYLRCRTLSFPFTLNVYTSGELITIQKNPKGFVGALLGVQLIFALCSATI